MDSRDVALEQQDDQLVAVMDGRHRLLVTIEGRRLVDVVVVPTQAYVVHEGNFDVIAARLGLDKGPSE